MIYKPKLTCHKKRPAAFIYTVVFNSRFSLLLIFILLLSFAVQPIHQAYANETVIELSEESNEPVVPDDVEFENETDEESTEELSEEINNTENENENEIEEEEVDGPEVISEVVVKNTSSDSESATRDASASTTLNQNSGNSNSVPGNATTSSVLNNNQESTTSTTTTQTQGGASSESGEQIDESAETGGSNNSGSESSTSTPLTSSTASDNSSTPTDQVDYEMSDNEFVEEGDETGSSTDEQIEDVTEPEVTEARVLVTEDNYYQFNRQACVAIGDGTFHCSVNTGVRMDMNAVVYAEMGERRNMEIYLRSSAGETEQITSNDYDDTAPHYDAESRQIVWQRLIDDRYQIVLYDLEEGEERQLTFSRSNNMEPKVSEEGIVWQAWDGNDWEIMYFDGTFTDQLTNNSVQDVAPAIDDGYVLWSVLGSDEQEAKVYSLTSGETLNISGYEGGVIANPRFVLVYDTKFENGDIITQGFDPTTGLSEPIAAKAADDPIEIPDSDSTGETRALIQNKSSQEEELEEGVTKKSPEAGGNATSTATSTTVSGDDATLNLSQVQSVASTTEVSGSTTPEVIPNDVLELTDFDLIIVPPEVNVDISDTNSASNTASAT